MRGTVTKTFCFFVYFYCVFLFVVVVVFFVFYFFCHQDQWTLIRQGLGAWLQLLYLRGTHLAENWGNLCCLGRWCGGHPRQKIENWATWINGWLWKCIMIKWKSMHVKKKINGWLFTCIMHLRWLRPLLRPVLQRLLRRSAAQHCKDRPIEPKWLHKYVCIYIVKYTKCTKMHIKKKRRKKKDIYKYTKYMEIHKNM